MWQEQQKQTLQRRSRPMQQDGEGDTQRDDEHKDQESPKRYKNQNQSRWVQYFYSMH